MFPKLILYIFRYYLFAEILFTLLEFVKESKRLLGERSQLLEELVGVLDVVAFVLAKQCTISAD